MTFPPRSEVPVGSEPALAVDASGLVPVAVGTISHLDRHPAAVYLASLSPGSRRTMRTALSTIAKLVDSASDEVTFPWSSLDYAHTSAIRTRLSETYAPATANKILAALRGVVKMSFRLGLINADQMTRAVSVAPVRGSRLPRGRSISQGELRALFGVCDPVCPIGSRDAALISLLYAAGLRRAEVVGLDLDSFDPKSGSILVRGKGNKERRVFITNGAFDAVAVWVVHRGREPGPLLTPVIKGGLIRIRRLTDAAVHERLAFVAKKAGVPSLSPHDLRRSFVGDMLDAGADIATVQQMAGHSSPTTTSRYDRRGDRAKKKAAGMLHVPFDAKGTI